MKRDVLRNSPCPVARSLARLGDAWSMLILRDAFQGMTRFDEFERSLGIAPNILTSRLKAMVADGLLERVRYGERPPRYEYRLTAMGWDARSVAFALLVWGNRHLTPEGSGMLVVDSETGEPADPTMVDRTTGRPLSDPAFRIMVPPPGARPAEHETSAGPSRPDRPSRSSTRAG